MPTRGGTACWARRLSEQGISELVRDLAGLPCDTAKLDCKVKILTRLYKELLSSGPLGASLLI